MKICSFDVGVKNLAYCILQKNAINKKIKYKISDWSIINLLNTETFTCQEIQKNKKACNKPAICWGERLVDGKLMKIYYCGTHKHSFDVSNDVFDPCKDKEITCDFFSSKKNSCCGKPARFYIDTNKESGYCASHMKKYKEGKINKIKKTKLKSISVQTIIIRLIEKLDTLPQLLQVDKVIIENQPSIKNPRMKTIASALLTYFTMRGIIDKKGNSQIDEVLFMCPSNKLKVDNDNTIKILSKTKENQKYKLTKSLGIKYCKQLIKHDKNNLEFLNSHKKKDDLCDSFLQGCYYLSKLV